MVLQLCVNPLHEQCVLCVYVCVVYFNVAALTFTNVSDVLKGIKWRILCRLLDISHSKRGELEASIPSIEQRRDRAIQQWITTDPLASWRRIVDHIYRWGSTDEKAIGDKIRHYCAELTGMCINTTQHRECDPAHVHVCLVTFKGNCYYGNTVVDSVSQKCTPEQSTQ